MKETIILEITMLAIIVYCKNGKTLGNFKR